MNEFTLKFSRFKDKLPLYNTDLIVYEFGLPFTAHVVEAQNDLYLIYRHFDNVMNEVLIKNCDDLYWSYLPE